LLKLHRLHKDSAQKTHSKIIKVLQDLEKICSVQSVAPSSGVNPKTSIADEILKFKNLLDQGIITQEEFEEKKKRLLAL